MEIKFLDLFIAIINKRKLIIISTILTFILSISLSLLLTLHYKASISFLPLETTSSSIYGSIIPNSDGFSGLNVLDNFYNMGPQHIKLILESKSLRTEFINKFNLIESYGLIKSKSKIKDALKILDKKIIINEVLDAGFGFSNIVSFEISVVDTSAKRSFDMVSFLFNSLQKRVNDISIQKAKIAISFIESQLHEVEDNLIIAKTNIIDFQKKHKIIEIEKQAEGSIDMYIEIKSQIQLLSVDLDIYRTSYGKNSPKIKRLKSRIRILKNKLNKIENQPSNDYIPSLDKIPSFTLQYEELTEQIKLLTNIYSMLRQQVEIAKIQEVKSIANIQVIDPPTIPEYKFKPKRALVVLGITFSQFLFIIFIICISYVYKNSIKQNETYKEFLRAIRKKK